MTHSDKHTAYSGFAQFSDHSARDRFVQSVLAGDPYLQRCAYLPESQPTIIFERLTAAQRDQIRSALKGLGRWFDDVQFQMMS
jgi:hypothetical protein